VCFSSYISLVGLIPPPATHKSKESFKSWSPSPKEIQALEGAEPIACQSELFFFHSLLRSLSSSTGRRGLLNLGQTCFLNVVLQCLAHNPLLRNYFLSDKHNHRQCKIENCTSCEMDKLFTEVVLFSFLVSQL
jgi:ubiquitin carboxyl-terminal hydrolase 22/27/51